MRNGDLIEWLSRFDIQAEVFIEYKKEPDAEIFINVGTMAEINDLSPEYHSYSNSITL